ncbi:C-4 methyl sterol oxidase [Russula emetica]|nr:C-4 methyl sterol oxidase [Russula emetica]
MVSVSDIFFSNVNVVTAKGWLYIIVDLAVAVTAILFTDPSLLAQTVYFGCCLPWIIIDAIPCFRKLQPNKVPMPEEQWECTKGVLFSHFTVEGPAIFLFHPVAESFGMSTWQVPFSSWQTMLMQLTFSFFFEDMFHYFCSFFALLGHHKYSAPFGLAAEYAHPLEVMILEMGTILGPLSTLGAEYHDFHHMVFVKNFSTSFRWWDRLLGTDKKYLAYGERVRAATKGLDAAQRKAVEEKMVVAEEEAIPM